MKISLLMIAQYALISIPLVSSSQQVIPFTSEQWQITSGKVIEHDGRQCLNGSAYLSDLEFQDGIIDMDIWFGHERGYPGINFRIQSLQDYENFYIRPHRTKFYPDALQYVPCINGIRGWQLYSGEGYTAGYDFPFEEWVHIKMEVKGKQARVFIQDMNVPALEIHDLKHGASKGTIGLETVGNAPVFFSNFCVDTTEEIVFAPPPLIHYPTGMIRDWEISGPYPLMDIDPEKTPEQQGFSDIQWTKVTADTSGLVDIAWYCPRSGRVPDCIFARTILYSDEEKVKEFRFGYSDAVSVFLNGKLHFAGNSAYQQRDPSFLGIVGLNDAVYLPLKTGKNELILLVTESFGGWGFMFQDAKLIEREDRITEIWQTANEFLISESVLYDPLREVLYVSNFDQFNMGNDVPSQFISRVSLSGEIMDLRWVNGLNNPTGMALFNDILYVADRKGVVKISLERAEVTERIDIPGAVFLNDIAVDDRGTVFISDSRKNVVWKCQGDVCEEWLTSGDVADPNALLIHKGCLLVGSSGDQCLKSFDLHTKEMKIIARLGEGFIDGIRPDVHGNLLVSQWQGRLFRISSQGQIKKILDISGPQYNLADFEYLTDRDIIFIPTFYDNRVLAFKLGLK